MGFKQTLYELQTSNSKELINFNFPSDQKFFYIDLNTRKIEAPENLSVRFDHNAETVFFVVDRYFDTVDLTKQQCIIQYQNANPNLSQSAYLYYVPYYSLIESDTKIIFPWIIEGAATAYTGDVLFSVRFYTLNESGEEFLYNLNTIPNKSKVLYGMDASGILSDYIYEVDPAQEIFNKIIVLEEKILNLENEGSNSEEISALNEKINSLEATINQKIDIEDLSILQNEINLLKQNNNSLQNKTTALENEVIEIKQSLSNLDTSIYWAEMN